MRLTVIYLLIYTIIGLHRYFTYVIGLSVYLVKGCSQTSQEGFRMWSGNVSRGHLHFYTVEL